ncbi:RICIN domain-containing protein [Streptomyces sp. HUAS TT11]|uniref:RICIN domain-containing protein n=1 Tax=Streptomyces sp. HUAS TT11 TaxID=3447508 RepID=UPI003F65BDD7
MRRRHQRALRALAVSAGALGLVAAMAQPSSASGSVYRVKNSYTGMCMGVGSETGNGAPVIQWPCTGAKDEQWAFTATDDGYGRTAYQIKNQYSGKCIGVGSSSSYGARLIQYTCTSANDEKWYGDPKTNGFLENVFSGYFAEPSSSAQGTDVIERYYVSGDSAQWWYGV